MLRYSSDFLRHFTMQLRVREGNAVRQLIDCSTLHWRSLVTWRGLIRRMSDMERPHCGHSCPRFTSSGVRLNSNRSHKDLDWQGVVDHIAADIWIVSVWLATLVCSHRARQQRTAARLCRRDPIVFPAAPCVPVYRVEEIALNPRCAAVQANPDFGDIGVPAQAAPKMV
jgi:hypothetical protein